MKNTILGIIIALSLIPIGTRLIILIGFDPVQIRFFFANNPSVYLWVVTILTIGFFFVEKESKKRAFAIASSLIGIVCYYLFFDSLLPF